MATRRNRDVNEIAKAIVDTATSDGKREPGVVGEAPSRKKDPAAVELGRRGGLKGGRSRMGSLTPKQRSRLGRKGARSRWAKARDTATAPRQDEADVEKPSPGGE